MPVDEEFAAECACGAKAVYDMLGQAWVCWTCGLYVDHCGCKMEEATS